MEEMGLRDFIRIIGKGKWLIAIVTVVCLVLGSLYTVFMIDESYQAEAVLGISPVNYTDGGNNIGSVAGIIEYLSLDPGMAMASYLEQITVAPVLHDAADILKDEYGLNYSIGGLKKRISIAAPKNTNLIYVRATDMDGDKAVMIANAVTESYIEYVSNVLDGYVQESLDFIKSQLELEKENVSSVVDEMTEFLSGSGSAEEIKNELAATLAALSSYKSQTMAIEISIPLAEAGLNAAEARLSELPQYFTVLKAVGDDKVLSEVLMENGSGDFSDIADIVMVEQVVNEAYIVLMEKISNYKTSIGENREKLDILNSKMTDLQSIVDNLQSILPVKEDEYKMLSEKLIIAEQTRSLYQNSLKIAETKMAANIGDKSVRLVARAEYAVADSPGKAIIIIGAGLAGLLLGIFGAFIMNALKEEKKKQKAVK